jgi:flagellar hook-basal body complex protein FliE
MTDIKGIGSPTGPGSPQGTSTAKGSGENFENMLKDALTKVNTVQNEAEKAIQELSTGGDVSSAVIAMEKADMTFQLMVEVRNRLLSAYEEMMRLQV